MLNNKKAEVQTTKSSYGYQLKTVTDDNHGHGYVSTIDIQDMRYRSNSKLR